jgi:hypothetical protein
VLEAGQLAAAAAMVTARESFKKENRKPIKRLKERI